MNWSYQNRHNLKIRLNKYLKERLVHNMILFSLTRLYFKIKMQFSTSMRLLQHPIWASAFLKCPFCFSVPLFLLDREA